MIIINSLNYKKTSFQSGIFLYFFWFSTICAALYFLLKPQISSSVVTDALLFFKSTLIPSLFPFLIASELLIRSGFGTVIGKLLNKPFTKMFRISGSGAAALILGSVSGYPIGAKTASSLYKSGDCTKKEAEHLIGFCNNAGPGFVIAGIGAAMWGSVRFGVILYITQLICALAAGALMRDKKQQAYPSYANSAYDTVGRDKKTPFECEKPQSQNISERDNFSKIFTQAVSEATLTMIKICGFILFFEIIIGGILNVISSFTENQTFKTFVALIFEISSGAENALLLSKYENTLFYPKNPLFSACSLAKTLTFFAVGWSGISVHMQVSSFVAPLGISMKTYYKTKLLQAVICAVCAVAMLSVSFI